MPQSKEAQLEALTGLQAEEARLEELVQKARKAIQLPVRIPLTRLQADDDKSRSVRARLMQEALEQASKAAGEAPTEDSSKLYGAQAALSSSCPGAGAGVGKDGGAYVHREHVAAGQDQVSVLAS